MKQNQIQDTSINLLRSTEMANIFNVYLNNNGKYIYNLLNTVHFPYDLNNQLYTAVFPIDGEYLTQFSYRMYKTIDLAWLIAAVNNIQNMLEPLDPTISLRVLSDSVVRDILLRIKTE